MIKISKIKGSITLFLAVVFMLLLILAGSLIESVREKLAKEIAMDDSYLAMQNILSEYQKELLDDYKVFFVDSSEIGGNEDLTKLGNKYLSKMLDSDYVKTSLVSPMAKFENLNYIENMTENNCYYFVKQAVSYMKYGAAKSLGDGILKNIKILEKAEKAGEALKRILSVKTKIEEKIAKILKIKSKIENKMNKINSKISAFKEAIDWNTGLEDIKNMYSKTMSSIGNGKNEIDREMITYQITKDDIKKDVQEYDEVLKKEKKDIEKEVYNSFENVKKDISDSSEISNIQDDFNDNFNLMNRIGEELSKEEVGEDYVKNLMSGLKTIKHKENVGLSKATKEAKKYQKKVKKAIGNNSSRSILSFFLRGNKEISKRKIKKIEWKEIKTIDSKKELSIVEKGIFLLYAKKHFTNFLTAKLDEDRDALKYGIEYLIVGGNKDENNVIDISTRILGIRILVQYSKLLTERDKVMEARGIALSIAGATGIPALATIIETGILMGWAVDRAREDIKILLDGGKIDAYPGVSEIKLGYENFLDAFMMMSFKNSVIRTVKLIEENIRFRYNMYFSASNLYAGVEGNVEFFARPKIFKVAILDSLIKKYIDNSPNELQLSQTLTRE